MTSRAATTGRAQPAPDATRGGEPPLIAIVDYGIGNLHSAQKGFEHTGARSVLTTDSALIAAADGVVLPGVGAFDPCMTALGRSGLDTAVMDAIESGRPFMGICVGMQMLFAGSDEAPGTSGLAVFEQRVRLLAGNVKRPQMQWNILRRRPEHADHPMLAGTGAEPWVYFVHSFAPEPSDNTVAVCDYGGEVTAAVARHNVWAVQFHPEKSSATGLRILANFAAAAADRRRPSSAPFGDHSRGDRQVTQR